MIYGYFLDQEDYNDEEKLDGVQVAVLETHDDKKLKALIEVVDEGDILKISRLSHLGNTTKRILKNIHDICSKSVTIVVDTGFTIDPDSQYGKDAFKLAEELYKVEETIPVGRPKKDIDLDKLIETLDKNIKREITVNEASKKLNISTATFNRRKKDYLEGRLKGDDK